MVPAYDGRQRKVQQELNERERDWGGEAEGGKPIFCPVLFLRGCLKASSEGILQMWSGTLAIRGDREQGRN